MKGISVGKEGSEGLGGGGGGGGGSGGGVGEGCFVGVEDERMKVRDRRTARDRT